MSMKNLKHPNIGDLFIRNDTFLQKV